jgi:hypothetical protein
VLKKELWIDQCLRFEGLTTVKVLNAIWNIGNELQELTASQPQSTQSLCF